MKCPNCDGLGDIKAFHLLGASVQVCSACGGSGKARTPEDLPPDVKPGQYVLIVDESDMNVP